jgi:hypothetical protein
LTLVVALRSLDGIVLAGDTLSTVNSSRNVTVKADVTCPSCSTRIGVSIEDQTARMPSSTLSHAQKIFPFLGRYGVGVHNAGQLAGQTVYFAMRLLQSELRKKPWEPESVLRVAEKIGERAHALARQEVPNLPQAADDWLLVGFQVSGYTNLDAQTVHVRVGREVSYGVEEGLGLSAAGESEITRLLFETAAKDEHDKPMIDQFALQDAIDYAEFLIQTTANFQRFSRKAPTVGGSTDISLITPFDGFRWIRRTQLAEMLGEH